MTFYLSGKLEHTSERSVVALDHDVADARHIALVEAANAHADVVARSGVGVRLVMHLDRKHFALYCIRVLLLRVLF
jgi:hypothetical protein